MEGLTKKCMGYGNEQNKCVPFMFKTIKISKHTKCKQASYENDYLSVTAKNGQYKTKHDHPALFTPNL